MDDQLFGSLNISTHGMLAQSQRIRVISENVANVGTAANSPNSDPYQRKTITFKNELDRELGERLVQVDRIEDDTDTPFPMKYLPDHPGADENGMVRFPNVNILIEMTDMREASRSYEANLGMLDQSKEMVLSTIDLLR